MWSISMSLSAGFWHLADPWDWGGQSQLWKQWDMLRSSTVYPCQISLLSRLPSEKFPLTLCSEDNVLPDRNQASSATEKQITLGLIHTGNLVFVYSMQRTACCQNCVRINGIYSGCTRFLAVSTSRAVCLQGYIAWTQEFHIWGICP